MNKAIYPGSFDPITLGHIDIVKRVHHQFDEVVVLISHSLEKKYLISAEKRAQLVLENFTEFPNVKVEIHMGLTVDFAKKIGAQVILRGLRAVVDFEYEFAMANMNKSLAPDIETMIVFASPEFNFVSSKIIKEVHHYGGDITSLVPKNVYHELQRLT